MSGSGPGNLFMVRRIRGLQKWCARIGVLVMVSPLLPLPVSSVEAGALERAMLGKSAIVDLTHPTEDSPKAPERPQPETSGEGSRDGHTGRGQAEADFETRLHAPGVVRQGKRTVAQIPFRELLVSAVVVDIAQQVLQMPEYQATAEDLRAWERKNGRIPKQSAVLLRTGWAQRWSDPARYANYDPQGSPQAPGFSAAALALLEERQVRGLGVDAYLPGGATAGAPGSLVVPSGVWQLENLANLDRLPVKGAKLIIAPLRMEAASAPARVMAILP
jgi:kynurenine formamidase